MLSFEAFDFSRTNAHLLSCAPASYLVGAPAVKSARSFFLGA